MITPEQLEGIRRRGTRFAWLLDEVASAQQGDTKSLQQELEQLQATLNATSKKIPTVSAEEKQALIAEMKPISDQIATLKATIAASARDIRVPNIPHADVPVGNSDADNVVLREVGTKREITHPKMYLELTEEQGMIDIQRAAKVSGSRFGYLVGGIAELEFALIQYAQSVILDQGFTMIVPPVMVKEESMEAMGYLNGGGEDETYHFAKDKLYLVGTSEQSVGPMHRDEVFREEDLPKRYLSFSTCFRREAGSYGKDTKGIIRVHQFDKLEMFSFTLPEHSEQEHENFLRIEEQLMQGLELPYRVVKLCTGDISWPSARTYDIETWMPGQGVYRETHSSSTTTDYQSAMLNIRVQRGNGKRELVHMLNGTAFAIGRIIIAIIENYQQPDGTIRIPDVLQPWMRGRTTIG
jgi:seryl-tRNA synthetase